MDSPCDNHRKNSSHTSKGQLSPPESVGQTGKSYCHSADCHANHRKKTEGILHPLFAPLGFRNRNPGIHGKCNQKTVPQPASRPSFIPLFFLREFPLVFIFHLSTLLVSKVMKAFFFPSVGRPSSHSTKQRPGYIPASRPVIIHNAFYLSGSFTAIYFFIISHPSKVAK